MSQRTIFFTHYLIKLLLLKIRWLRNSSEMLIRTVMGKRSPREKIKWSSLSLFLFLLLVVWLVVSAVATSLILLEGIFTSLSCHNVPIVHSVNGYWFCVCVQGNEASCWITSLGYWGPFWWAFHQWLYLTKCSSLAGLLLASTVVS